MPIGIPLFNDDGNVPSESWLLGDMCVCAWDAYFVFLNMSICEWGLRIWYVHVLLRYVMCCVLCYVLDLSVMATAQMLRFIFCFPHIFFFF